MKYNIKSTSTENRLQMLKALEAVGLRPHGGYKNGYKTSFTAQQFSDEYPQDSFPVIFVNFDLKEGQVAGNRSADRYTSLGDVLNAWLVKTAQVIKPVVFPAPAKYSLKYRKSGGEIEDYVISNPIEDDDVVITCYSYGKGIRSFIKTQIIALEKV